MDFKSRVTIPSIKNFQLESAEGEVVMQFGRVGKDVFTMDFKVGVVVWSDAKSPLTLFQAFCIALTRFYLCGCLFAHGKGCGLTIRGKWCQSLLQDEDCIIVILLGLLALRSVQSTAFYSEPRFVETPAKIPSNSVLCAAFHSSIHSCRL